MDSCGVTSQLLQDAWRVLSYVYADSPTQLLDKQVEHAVIHKTRLPKMKLIPSWSFVLTFMRVDFTFACCCALQLPE